MSTTPTPRVILETLLPHLKVAAGYARQIQSRLTALPDKAGGDNVFATALTDADLAIQNLVEVVLLGTFPEIRFYGEEHEQSRNTKYFRSIELGSHDDYLVTLDPIDGTRFYLDGHSNYQIILTVLNTDDYEAVLAISPAENIYFYALRGEGAFSGSLEMNLKDCTPLQIKPHGKRVFLGFKMSHLAPPLKGQYEVISIDTDYSNNFQTPNLNNLLTGDFCGAVTRSGNFIDGGALAFLAREAGFIVTTLEGYDLPPLHTCVDYKLPGLIVANSREVHKDLLAALT
ncbi:inositol monophosphatase family protein [Aetokthonos hydrillicola Thurmond2011]|jgi:fructose-1,6-bisphosphatase/inositol monophosphatase family enzyme|uniref:Inositol monophosphatase family protein n=1 Tax=Aetokthonos hydrillicola Thurmond2011 TaxID=2712845 RepID=A0AAP5I9A6_9CYAN|nr:inositol monophosphatase family protein [Aetokthonos hydrillicola]MBO3461456.1 inositol monophosphatase family protein [Aetokthonos hydrillicola CCALA 1050]MBW4588798.1 inositol monophosphatase family protein [Aetokthonos hydrillicola CCALA 1050]MDR9897338.1 inositol monophosphatase family protein [Aetokthonos hydrillicola Thurmond2011]